MIDPVGVKATKEITEVLNSVLHPPSKELGNYIADKIRYLRYGSLLKILKKAEEKAKAEGMALKMPPLKFFVPFAEAASLEEDVSIDNLQDAWANLLMQSTDEVNSRHLLYIRILKEITAREIKYLTKMVAEGRGKSDGVWVASWWHHHDCGAFDLSWFTGFLETLDPVELVKNGTDIAKLIIENTEQPGLILHNVEIREGYPPHSGDDIFYEFDAKAYYDWKSAVDVLSALNLVKEFHYDDVLFPQHNSYSAEISGCVLTDLGINFYDVCSGKDMKKSSSP